MLILSRAIGENVVIQVLDKEERLLETILISVLHPKRFGISETKLGFTASNNVIIDREEVYKAKVGGNV